MPWLSSSNNNTANSNNNDRHKAVQDVIQRCLAPPAPLTASTADRRFSTLLLEHGETDMHQDWAVVAYSTPVKLTHSSSGISSSSSTSPSSAAAATSTIQWAQKKQTTHSPPRRTLHKSSTPPPVVIDKEQYPTMRWNNIHGRLHLCSRSLVLEPTDASRPIVRIPLAKLDGLPVVSAANAVECVATVHVTMRAHNVIGPYTTVPHATRFCWQFLHSPPTEFRQACQPLYYQQATVSKSSPPKLLLPPPPPPPEVWDVRQTPLVTLPCQILEPLVATPAVVVVTTTHLHLQAASGTTRYSLNDVAATARRYHGLRDAALEIYWQRRRRSAGLLLSKQSSSSSHGGGSSTLLALHGRHDREVLWRLLPSTAPCVTDRSFLVDAAQAWHARVLSNYDYLLALNAAAGRSFHDLSRYPVFPWVIADYTSAKLRLDDPATFRDLTKPVGALNAERLAYFTTRLEGMQDMPEKFLYGTHYSAPGYVLYYLVRSMPEHMLCLQNGKFDAPDRMFHSIAHCYKCVLSNHADVKELIPEFYNAGHDFDFLINARGLSLGATQNGERVDDVQLPPWARSARDFIKKNRQALEAPYVTQRLPRWIDLIFGATSRGDAARQAHNLFHQMAYLGPRDLADMPTEAERYTAELQATEFGIVPDQLFVETHPTRADEFDESFIAADVGRASSKDEDSSAAWELLDTTAVTVIANDNPAADPAVEEEPPSSSSFFKDTLSTSSSGNMPLRGSGDGLSVEIRTAGSFGEMNKPKMPEVKAPAPSPPEPALSESTKSAEWDMSVVERRKIHNDTVSSCVLWLDEKDSERSILVSTSLDGGLSVHKITLDETPPAEQDKGGFTSTFAKFSYSTIMSRAQGQSSQSKLTEYRTHSSRDPLASLVLASDGADGHVAFAGGHDDVVLVYGINSACAVASVYSHRDAVTGLDLITRTPLDGACVLWPDKSTHIMVSGSWDATVKVWSATVAKGESVTIQREPLAELFDADSGIVCTSSITVPTGGIVIAAGCADGSFCVWNVHNDGVQVVLHNEAAKRGSGPCSVVQWVAEGGNLHLFAAFSTGKVASYTLMDGRLQRVSAVSVGVAILSMRYSNGVLLVGCSDGGLRLIPVRPGSSFGTKPTLWSAVNHKGSPGISCISVTYMDARCICCTGGEDGSILIFELKRVVHS